MPKSLKNYRDKEKARAQRNKDRRENYASSQYLAVNSKKPWGPWEVEAILDEDEWATDRELASFLGRSVQAIQVKRCALKKEIILY